MTFIMKNSLLFILVSLLFFSCTDKKVNDTKTLTTTKVDIVNIKNSPLGYCDTVKCDIKITEKGKKINFGVFDTSNVTVTETGFPGNFYPVVRAINSIKGEHRLNKDQSILILMDISKTITHDVIDEQKKAIRNFLDLLPDTKIYISFMDSKISESKLISERDKKGNYSVWNEESKNADIRDSTDKFLYKAILAKIEELSGLDKVHYPEVEHNDDLADTTGNPQKMLFILTDGKVKDEKGDFYGGFEDYNSWRIELLSEIKDKISNKEIRNIPIHCFYFGDKDGISDIEREMNVICNTGTDDDEKGKFYYDFTPEQLQEIMGGSLDSLEADYELVLVNKPGKIYKGDPNKLQISIERNGRRAFGEKENTLGGNPYEPIKHSYQGNKWSTILMGLLFGTLFIIMIYLVVQLLIPYIRYQKFKKRFVIPYRKDSSDASGNMLIDQKCFYCKAKFESGDDVVIKCEHTMHLHCWEQNRNRCPEYGSKCNKGTHYYNKNKLTDLRNATHYLPWILYGLAGGILSWFFFKIIYSDSLFNGLISSMVDVFYPISHPAAKGKIDGNIILEFNSKISALLFSGTLLGLFLTFMFSFFIEFRKKTLKIIGNMLIRSFISSMFGFVSFLLGAIIIIIAGKSTNCLWIDWVPWLFFATVMALAVSYKTDIKFKNAFIGGIISVLFSFIVLYLSTFAQEIIGMFSYMFYAAGLGISIAVVHFISQKYVLRTKGSMKERDIAIYKWMNVSGGFNKVTIGKSIDSIIQINWDDKGDIADNQVELYLDNDRPYCKALENGATLGNGRALRKGEIILLSHGITFKIGNTDFTYIEKDR
jgi:hypothetical protein